MRYLPNDEIKQSVGYIFLVLNGYELSYTQQDLSDTIPLAEVHSVIWTFTNEIKHFILLSNWQENKIAVLYFYTIYQIDIRRLLWKDKSFDVQLFLFHFYYFQ